MNRPSPIRARGWISIPVSAREKYAIARGSDRHLGHHERVRDAVHEQRVQARPLREDLGGGDRGGRGIALAHGGDVAAQLPGDPADAAQHLSPTVRAVRIAMHTHPRELQRHEVDGQERVAQRRRTLLRSFIASSACSEPSTPAAGPRTPASAHDGASTGSTGNAQR